MRKVRDFDAELKVLADRQRALKAKVRQLGELVIATGAEALSIEELAGALIEAGEAKANAKEAWRRRGAEFFRARSTSGRGSAKDESKSETGSLFLQSTASKAGA